MALDVVENTLRLIKENEHIFSIDLVITTINLPMLPTSKDDCSMLQLEYRNAPYINVTIMLCYQLNAEKVTLDTSLWSFFLPLITSCINIHMCVYY